MMIMMGMSVMCMEGMMGCKCDEFANLLWHNDYDGYAYKTYDWYDG